MDKESIVVDKQIEEESLINKNDSTIEAAFELESQVAFELIPDNNVISEVNKVKDEAP